MSPSTLTRRRGWFVTLLAGLALATALATGLFDTGHPAAADAGHRHAHATVTKGRAAAFQDQMRKLWEDHVTWTRLAIVTFADGSGGFDASATRLLQNQKDIGAAIKPFYGKAAGDQLTALLTDHITIAVELLQAAKSGDDAAFADAHARWYANSDDIADFLAKANPAWPKAELRDMMETHITTTIGYAGDVLAGNHADAIADYDQAEAHMIEMADMLSQGLIAQFPDTF